MFMLNLFRRHTPKCPHRRKGREYLKCNCPIHVDGVLPNGERYRDSLKTRDWSRAKRRLVEIEGDGAPPPEKRNSKLLQDAISDFLAQYPERSETRRKYKWILGYLAANSISELTIISDGKDRDAVTVELIDGYMTSRNNDGWSRIKEIEIIRSFFAFCIDRDWLRKNPARNLKRAHGRSQRY